MPGRPQVLVAFSDPEGRRALTNILTQRGLEPIFISTVKEARAILVRKAFGLIFCESCLADGSFRDLLQAQEFAGSKAPVVVASRVGDWNEYLEAMRLGAFDFVASPYRFAEVERIVSRAFDSVLV